VSDFSGKTRDVKDIHNRFSRFNVFGEWFRPNDELLRWIEGVETGEQVLATAPKENIAWTKGEKEMADLARSKAKRMVQIRRQLFGAKTDTKAIEGICNDHGIRRWFFTSLLSGRALTVGAYAFSEIEKALLADMETGLENLRAEVSEVHEAVEIDRLAEKVRQAKSKKGR